MHNFILEPIQTILFWPYYLTSRVSSVGREVGLTWHTLLMCPDRSTSYQRWQRSVQLSSIKKHRVSCFRNIPWCHAMQLQFALWHTTITLENCRKTSECLDNIWVDFQASSTLIGQVFSHLSAHVGCIQVNALFHILFCQPPHAPWSSSRSCWTLLFSSWAWGQTYGSCSFTFKVTTVCLRNTKYVASININLPNVQHTII